MGEAERGEAAPRVWVSFWCSNGHETRPSFASDAAIPEQWECPRCGFPAGQDQASPPAPPRVEPYKTHLAYALADGVFQQALLAYLSDAPDALDRFGANMRQVLPSLLGSTTAR